jgi:hypothetical protein
MCLLSKKLFFSHVYELMTNGEKSFYRHTAESALLGVALQHCVPLRHRHLIVYLTLIIPTFRTMLWLVSVLLSSLMLMWVNHINSLEVMLLCLLATMRCIHQIKTWHTVALYYVRNKPPQTMCVDFGSQLGCSCSTYNGLLPEAVDHSWKVA